MNNFQLVAIEGIDGSGKSEALPLIVAQFDHFGLRAVQWPKIQNRPIRSLYKALINNTGTFPNALTSTYLALADYANSLQNVPSDADILVADRYIYSALADAIALGHSAAEHEILQNFKAPDLTIYIEVPPAVAVKRKTSIAIAEAGGPESLRHPYEIEKSFVAYQTKVHEAFRRLFQRHDWGHVEVVDGSRSRREVQKDVIDYIDKYFASAGKR